MTALARWRAMRSPPRASWRPAYAKSRRRIAPRRFREEGRKESRVLIITRKTNEAIILAGNIRVLICEVGRGRVKLGIEAPKELPVVREELLDTDRR